MSLSSLLGQYTVFETRETMANFKPFQKSCKSYTQTGRLRRTNTSSSTSVRFAKSSQPTVWLNQITWSSILTQASWRKRHLLGGGVQAFGPLGGISVINYYGPQIYKSLGITNQTSLMIIGISGALSIVYCTIGLWLLDRVGRMKPLIVSAGGLASALVVNAALSQRFGPNDADQLRALVAMNFVFSLFYTPLGIISWVYPAEIFPVEIRNQGNSITTFTNRTINLMFAQFSPGALKNIVIRILLCSSCSTSSQCSTISSSIRRRRVRRSSRWMRCSAIRLYRTRWRPW